MKWLSCVVVWRDTQKLRSNIDITFMRRKETCWLRVFLKQEQRALQTPVKMTIQAYFNVPENILKNSVCFNYYYTYLVKGIFVTTPRTTTVNISISSVSPRERDFPSLYWYTLPEKPKYSAKTQMNVIWFLLIKREIRLALAKLPPMRVKAVYRKPARYSAFLIKSSARTVFME